MLINEMLHDERAQRGINRKVWVTGDTKEIAICDMSTSHIRNTINWMRKNKFSHEHEYLVLFNKELETRGEK